MARQSRRNQIYKKRALSRKPKKRTIQIVSRRGQPQVETEVLRLKRQDIGGSVSSSWISALAWDNKNDKALMYLLNGYFYDVFITFKVFEEWYYAHSKGTFFNENIKDKYKVVRVS
jgi:hypothetical protein